MINRAVTRGLDENVKLKDSGVEWIGMIPEHWEVKRMKSIFTECKAVTETGNEDLLSVSEYYGVARRVDKMEDGEYESRAESLIDYKICKKGDLVINIMLAWKRGLGFSDYDGIVSPAYAVYRAKGIVPHYFHYLMRTEMYVAEYKRHSKGIIDSRLRLYTDRFNNIMVVVPPYDVQQAIAAYLDEKCAKIDAAIANIDKQTDALRRLKRSLINEVISGKRMIE
jgi:type I restriction enzyme S subunit